MKTRKKKSRPIFSPLDRARVVHKRFALWPKLLCYIGYATTKRDPGQCTLTCGQSKHRNQLIVPLPELLREKKKRGQFLALLIEQEWLINALLYGQNIVLYYIVHAATAWKPGQCTLTGSQSKHRNQLIVPLPEILLYNLLVLIRHWYKFNSNAWSLTSDIMNNINTC